LNDYTDWYDAEEDSDYGYQELSDEGRVTVHYVRPGRAKVRDRLRYEDGYVLERRRSYSSRHGKDSFDPKEPIRDQNSKQKQNAVLTSIPSMRGKDDTDPLAANRDQHDNQRSSAALVSIPSRLGDVSEQNQCNQKCSTVAVQQIQSHTEKVVQEVVSFYFTNIPADISYSALRQGFEVCGIMEDVYLARKRNVNGGAFGFVRYAKVKDVEKLLKALNNVWFGDWKVVAKWRILVGMAIRGRKVMSEVREKKIERE
jgi:hypothetical protein